GSFFATPDDRH
nr:RecName: Full=Unknown protein 7 from 2D-PAGE [Fructilactobacillus sanfranciscensis]